MINEAQYQTNIMLMTNNLIRKYYGTNILCKVNQASFNQVNDRIDSVTVSEHFKCLSFIE
jgi:hypothetical protein